MKPLVVVISLLVTVAAGLGQEQRPSFRSTADAVLVHVSVRDGRRAVTGLRCEDFTLVDSKVPQALTSCDYATMPLDLQIVRDRSDSITDTVRSRLDLAGEAIHRAAVEGDRLSQVEFATAIQAELAPAKDRTDSGHTTLWDAIASAMLRAEEPGRRRLAFALTDGVDSGSILPEEVVQALVTRSDTALHILAVADRRPRWLSAIYRSEAPDYFWFLKRLADISGGSFSDSRPPEDLSGWIAEEITIARTQYLLRYVPQGVEGPGWHPIDVRVPKHRGYEIVARRGYHR